MPIRKKSGNLFIDPRIYYHSLKDTKTSRKNVAIASIDDKKRYDIVSQTWIIKCLKMYKIADKIIENWSVELRSEVQTLAEIKIPRGIFQGDSISLLLFVTTTMSFIHVFRKCTGGYKFSKSQEKIN